MWEFEKYANNTLDCELLGKIKIVKTYSIDTPVYINKILRKCVTDLKDAGMVLIYKYNIPDFINLVHV